MSGGARLTSRQHDAFLRVMFIALRLDCRAVLQDVSAGYHAGGDA